MIDIFDGEIIKGASNPIPGRELGELVKVSRQVISGDITLLKAKGEPIIATIVGMSICIR